MSGIPSTRPRKHKRHCSGWVGAFYYFECLRGFCEYIEIKMQKREVRKLLILYQTLGPMLVVAVGFLAIAVALSFFMNGMGAKRLRVAGLALFCIFLVIGLVQTGIVLWKTRDLDP